MQLQLRLQLQWWAIKAQDQEQSEVLVASAVTSASIMCCIFRCVFSFSDGMYKSHRQKQAEYVLVDSAASLASMVGSKKLSTRQEPIRGACSISCVSSFNDGL